MAGIIEQQPCQQMVGLAAYDGLECVGTLGEGFLSDDASNSARSMIEGCSPGRISFLYLTSPI